MMKKKQSIIALVLAAIVTVLLGWTMIKGWGPTGTGSMKNINLGLDLSGGVSITYQAVKDNPTDEEMSDTARRVTIGSPSVALYYAVSSFALADSITGILA